MRVLTYKQCAAWCRKRGYPTRQFEGYIVGPDPDLESGDFHFIDFWIPEDAGRRVYLVKLLFSFLKPAKELLVWVGDWAVWPSGQHMPLFTRFREAFGEHRRLIEAPGHLVRASEGDDAQSILVVATLFLWNCHVLCGNGDEALFVSHDEWGRVAVRRKSRVASIERTLTEMGFCNSPPAS